MRIQIRIQLFTLMRIRIQSPKNKQIHPAYDLPLPQNGPYIHGGFDVLILDLLLDVRDILVIILCSQANQSIIRPIDKFTTTNCFRASPNENDCLERIRTHKFRMFLGF